LCSTIRDHSRNEADILCDGGQADHPASALSLALASVLSLIDACFGKHDRMALVVSQMLSNS